MALETITPPPENGEPLLYDREEYARYRNLQPDEKAAAGVPQSEKPEEDADNFGHYVKGNKIIFVKSRGKAKAEQRVSNFAFSLDYQFDDGSENNTYLLKWANANTGQRGTIEINDEELSNLTAFKKRLNQKGCTFTGGSMELGMILERLHLLKQYARKIDILGQDADNDIYYFANGILKDGDFIQVNKFGLVQAKELVYLPYYAEANKNNNKFDGGRAFLYTPNPQANAEIILSLLYKAYGINGLISAIFTCSALFRDVIINSTGFFPYLFIFGEAGTGKTTLINFLLSFFGRDIKGVSVSGGSSLKGVARSFSQRRNSIIYLKEYTNNIDREFDSLLKVVYDGQAYTTAQTDNSNETNTRAVNSAIIIDGNELPTNNDAVFSRVILAELRSTKFTEEQTAAHEKLLDLQQNTFTDTTRQLLRLRPDFIEKFEGFYNKSKKELRQATEIELSDRTRNHGAMMLSCFDIIVNNNISLPISRRDFVEQLIRKSEEVEEEIKQNRATTIFWQLFSQAVNGNTPGIQKHFVYILKGNILVLQLDQITSYIYKLPQHEKLGDQSTLKKLLTGSSYKPYKPKNGEKGRKGQYYVRKAIKDAFNGKTEEFCFYGYGYAIETKYADNGNKVYNIDGVEIPNNIVLDGVFTNNPNNTDNFSTEEVPY